jgi:glycosyltransferase involved in cell wall biosynthesis
MKILLCHNYYRNPGGESDVFESQARGLRAMGDEIVSYCRQNTDIEHYSLIGKANTVVSAYYSRRTIYELRQMVRQEKPDFALVQNVFPLLSPSVYFALKEARIPVIQAVYNYRFICPSAELYTEGEICERCVPGNTIHAVIHKCYRDDHLDSAWYASIIGIHRWMQTFVRNIDSFMVPDNFLGNKLIQGGIPAEKIWRNPNPFFVNEYIKNDSHRGYILFVGRLVRQKGIVTLLNAMKYTGIKSRLVIVGLGELESFIREFIAFNNLSKTVDYLGPRWGDDVNQLIENCAAIVIPSEWYDNLPMILCRANATGKPVIASRINGIPEYVQEGINGYLFEPGDEVELAGLIDKILNMSTIKYQNISVTSRKIAEDVMDYSNHYRNLMEHVQNLDINNNDL